MKLVLSEVRLYLLPLMNQKSAQHGRQQVSVNTANTVANITPPLAQIFRIYKIIKKRSVSVALWHLIKFTM